MKLQRWESCDCMGRAGCHWLSCSGSTRSWLGQTLCALRTECLGSCCLAALIVQTMLEHHYLPVNWGGRNIVRAHDETKQWLLCPFSHGGRDGLLVCFIISCFACASWFFTPSWLRHHLSVLLPCSILYRKRTSLLGLTPPVIKEKSNWVWNVSLTASCQPQVSSDCSAWLYKYSIPSSTEYLRLAFS